MGDKAKARETAKSIGVPILPGSDGPVRTYEEAVEVAKSIGYPVILKASAVGAAAACASATAKRPERGVDTARSEAERAFGSADVYIEKVLEHPRHIEIQVFGDTQGRIVSLGERECSIQRRHQKLIEESPSPALTHDLRKAMGEAAIRLCQAVTTSTPGPIEFLFRMGSSISWK